MKLKNLRVVALLLGVSLLSLLCAPESWAQLPTGDIIGTVTDASGAAIPKAHVTVTNTGTGETRSTDSGASGDYAFPLLQLGTYSVSVEAQGFKKLTAPAITLQSGDRKRVDAKMEVGDVSQSIEVSGLAPALQTDTSTISGVVGEQAVQDIPLNGRNFIDLARMAPGASEGNPQGFGTGTRPDDRRPSSQITVNAQNDSVNNKTIDGMDNNEAVIGTIGVQPSIDAIQEVRVQTNLYTAEVGRTAGAAIDIITKSGTNNFHGSVYEFLRNDIFDARSYFDTPQVGRKPELRQNQFGGSLGGPIRKNKTFFFGDYEGERVVQGLAVPLATVPTDCELGRAACNGITQLGNFSDLKATIYDPTTGSPFPGNVIPLNRIGTVAKNFASMYPSANLPGAISAATGQPSNNFGSSPLRTQNLTTMDGRVDHHFNDANTLSGRYTINNITTQTPGNFPAVSVAGLNISPGGDAQGSINAFAGGNQERAQNAALSYSHIFSSAAVMQLNLAYTRVAILSTPLNFGTNAAQAFGLPGINVPGVASGFASGLPFVQLSGYSNLGDDNFVPLKYIDNAFQYNGNMTWTKGNHVIKFGLGLIHRNFTAVQSQFPDSNYVFSQTATSQQNATSFTNVGGNSFASMLLGYAQTVQRNLSLTAPYYSTNEPNAYVEDNWRMQPWLTLNLGLRWDLFTPWTERNNLMSNFNPQTGLLEAASASDPTALVQTVYHDFGPRVGFAADLGHGTVLRGGFGTMFFPARYASFFQLKNPPFSSAFQTNFSSLKSDFGSAPTFSTAIPAPTPIPVVCGTPITISNCPSQQINAIAPDWRPSYVYQTSLQLQKDFSGNVIGVGYVGEFGHALNSLIDINQLNTPGPQPAGTALILGKPQPTQPYSSTYPKVAIISQAQNAANSSFNGLQVTYERRYKAGLTVNANYTLGHEIDNDIYPGFNLYPSCAPQYNCIVDNGNGTTHTVHGLQYERGNGAYDVRNRWVAAINYQFPFGRTATGVQRQLIQGWQFNTLASWTSGLPVAINETNNATLSQVVGTGGNSPGARPNLVGPLSVSNGVASSSGIPWINLGGMSAQAIGTLGNMPRDAFNGPPLRHIDVSLFKDFPVRESLKLQFRAEMFNLTNTPNFALPIATIAGFSGGTTGTPTNAGGFGTITATAPNATPRQMQFALKVLF